MTPNARSYVLVWTAGHSLIVSSSNEMGKLDKFHSANVSLQWEHVVIAEKYLCCLIYMSVIYVTELVFLPAYSLYVT